MIVDCEACVALKDSADGDTALDEMVSTEETDPVAVDSVTPRPWRMNEPSPAAEEELDDSETSEVVSVCPIDSNVNSEVVLLKSELDAKLLVVELSVAFASALQHLRLQHIARRKCQPEPMAVIQNEAKWLDHAKKVWAGTLDGLRCEL